MTLTEVLFSRDLLLALAVFAAASLAAAWLAVAVEERLDHGVQDWLWQHLYVPLLRAALLCLFLALAYPALFGLEEAPPVTGLLSADGARAGHVLGAVFLLSLALPLLPLRYAGPPLALPLQGIAASTLLFSWLTEAVGAPQASLWVGAPTLALMGGLALVTHWAAGRVLEGLEGVGTRVLGVSDLDTALRELVTLWIQVPVVVLYTLGLGANLTAGTAGPS